MGNLDLEAEKKFVRGEIGKFLIELGRLGALLAVSYACLLSGEEKLQEAAKQYHDTMTGLMKAEKGLPPDAKLDVDRLPASYDEIQETFSPDSPRLPKAYQCLEDCRKKIFIEVPMFIMAALALGWFPIKKFLDIFSLVFEFSIRYVGSSFESKIESFLNKTVERFKNRFLKRT